MLSVPAVVLRRRSIHAFVPLIAVVQFTGGLEARLV
jgi:hypothetical protein